MLKNRTRSSLFSKWFTEWFAGWIVVLMLLSGCAPLSATESSLTPEPEPMTTPDPPLVVSVTEDLAYTIPQFGVVLEQHLDVYAPQTEGSGSTAPWPVVIFAHGLLQEKGDFAELSEAIAAQGSVVFTVDWPIYSGGSVARKNGAKLREMSESLVCAVRFASQHAGDYGGDPEKLILAGFSAGAGTGSLVALADESLDEQWETLASETGEPARQAACVAGEGAAHVDGFVGIGGPYGRLDAFKGEMPWLWSVAAESAHVGENTELIVRLLHGETDSMVPTAASEAFAETLSAAGYDVELARFESGHKVPRALTLTTIAELIDQLADR